MNLFQFDGNKAFKHLEYMEKIGPRVPHSDAHIQLERYIQSVGKKCFAQFYEQRFQLEFQKKWTDFVNLIYIFPGKAINKKKILLGTHYDCRIIADNELDRNRKNHPIPGINDGGSGTAVFIELLKILDETPPDNDVAIVFFDGEDVGDIDGYEFCEGSKYFAEHFTDFIPDEVIIIDMIGGKDAVYHIDLDAYHNSASRILLKNIWGIGLQLGLPQFINNKDGWGSHFICDHVPFNRKNIPSMLLIDIEYPQWHTQNDICEYCSPESLAATGMVLLEYLYNSKYRNKII